MAGELAGKIALVTGAGRGIGRALALGLAGAGCAVAAADLDAAGVEETAVLVRGRGGDAISLAVDVADGAAVDRMFAAVQERWGCSTSTAAPTCPDPGLLTYARSIRRYTPGEPGAMVMMSRIWPDFGEEVSRWWFHSALSETFGSSNSYSVV